MAELSVAAAIGRSEMGLSNLDLHNPAGGYEVVAFGAGAVTWRRQTITSPLTAGARLVAAVKDTRNLSLAVRSRGANATQLNARMQILLRAFEQFLYDVYVVIDGVTFYYRCQPADYVPMDAADEVDKYGLMANVQTTRFDIPAHPTPYYGGV